MALGTLCCETPGQSLLVALLAGLLGGVAGVAVVWERPASSRWRPDSPSWANWRATSSGATTSSGGRSGRSAATGSHAAPASAVDNSS